MRLVDQLHAVPSVAVDKHEDFVEVFDGVYDVIRKMRKEVQVRKIKLHPKNVRIVGYDDWIQARKRCSHQDRLTVGLFDPDSEKCFVRNDLENLKRIEQHRAFIKAECMSTIAHEMIHYASRGGFGFSEELNEGITSHLEEDPAIKSLIFKSTFSRPGNNAYESEVEMWRSMEALKNNACTQIMRAFWYGDDEKCQGIIHDHFSPEVLATLQRKRRVPEKVMRLINKDF